MHLKVLLIHYRFIMVLSSPVHPAQRQAITPSSPKIPRKWQSSVIFNDFDKLLIFADLILRFSLDVL